MYTMQAFDNRQQTFDHRPLYETSCFIFLKFLNALFQHGKYVGLRIVNATVYIAIAYILYYTTRKAFEYNTTGIR